jgi:hypothetical protein
MNDLRSTFASAAGGRDRLAQNFSARTFGDLGRRADREIDDAAATAAEAFTQIDQVAKRLGFTDPDELARLKGEWLAAYRSKWADYQAAGSRVLNWMITGPARFPVERNRKRMDTEHRRLGEMLAFSKGARAWAEKRIKRQVRQALGPVGVADVELEEARQELARRERRQELMKAANAAVRRHKAKGEGAAAAIAAELAPSFPEITASIAAKLLVPDCFGIQGFAGFQLSNNNAEIRRRRDRVAVLERRAAAVAAAADQDDELELEPCNTVRIVENALEQRVQILFPDKPSAEIRTRLKRAGFRWAPSSSAWQRQLTANGIAAARAIVDQLNQENG